MSSQEFLFWIHVRVFWWYFVFYSGLVWFLLLLFSPRPQTLVIASVLSITQSFWWSFQLQYFFLFKIASGNVAWSSSPFAWVFSSQNKNKKCCILQHAKTIMSCTASLANRMFTHGYKTVRGTRINFPLNKSLISALISTAHKMCLVVCAEAIYSNTPLPKDWVKTFTLKEQYNVKPT